MLRRLVLVTHKGSVWFGWETVDRIVIINTLQILFRIDSLTKSLVPW